MQTYPEPSTAHVPPLTHGALLQGVTSHVNPEKPAGQEHTKSPLETAQLPPLVHGADVQGVISQFVPEKPVGQVHSYELPTTVHVPPF